jgi:peptidoglycan/LPS O-acetylase OafA/YrhL
MPEPVKRGQRYMPGLDGLRAVAVLGVLAYHLGADWIPGGLLGVGVFFTLSGYLITDILLSQLDRGGIKLGQFWLARARRLLPAVILLLIVVMAWVTVIGPHQTDDFRWAAASALGYVNNWWLIFHDVSYFEQFGAPEPLNHLWSLSIEEQFYILWPFLLMLGARFIPDVSNRMGVRPRLALATLGLAFVSAILMVAVFDPGIDPSRVYYGTDTRAQELLVGAALAMMWPSRRLRADITPSARRALDVQGWAGLAVIGLMFWRCGEFSPFLYRGGFLLLSFSTAMLVAALAHPASRIGPILGCAPMRWIGQRSYGIYLWHFPIIILTTPEGAEIGGSLPRALAQLAATLAIAALSWKYVEDPIRHGALKRLRGPQRVTREAWAGIAVAAVVCAAALAGMAGVGAVSRANTPGEVTVATTLESGEVADDANRTSCRDGTHIGDSTSEGLISPDYLPNVKQQIPATYARAGIERLNVEISGARSIYETYEGAPNAEDVALSWKDQGFAGCWVLALGTNEAANVAAGSNIGYDERIETMMDAVEGDPVLWVNVRTLGAAGPYAETNMAAWNRALLAACDTYPNMRIYDWASDVRDDWFVEDGIHFTTPGYAARSRLIASALLEAFPANAPVVRTPDQSCVIHPSGVLPPPPKQGSGGSGASAGA